jgi:hypothetical protein
MANQTAAQPPANIEINLGRHAAQVRDLRIGRFYEPIRLHLNIQDELLSSEDQRLNFTQNRQVS